MDRGRVAPGCGQQGDRGEQADDGPRDQKRFVRQARRPAADARPPRARSVCAGDARLGAKRDRQQPVGSGRCAGGSETGRALRHERPRVHRRAAVSRGIAVRREVQPQWKIAAHERRARRPVGRRRRVGHRHGRARHHGGRPVRLRARGRHQRRPAVDRPRRTGSRAENLQHEGRLAGAPHQETHRVGHRGGVFARQQISRDGRPQRRPRAVGGGERTGDVFPARPQGRDHGHHVARGFRDIRLGERGRHAQAVESQRWRGAAEHHGAQWRGAGGALHARRPGGVVRARQQGPNLGHERKKFGHARVQWRPAESRDVQRRRQESCRERLEGKSFRVGCEERQGGG